MREFVIKLHGGLGNQLFQYAFAVNIKEASKKSNVYFDLSFFREIDQKYPREFMLDKFLLPVEIFEYNDKNINPNVATRIYSSIKRKIFFKKSPLIFQRLLYYFNCIFGNVVNEVFEFGYVGYVHKRFGRSCLGNQVYNGYWADIRYFEKIKSLLQTQIKLKKTSNLLSELIQKIRTDDILIHIRRGDYLKIKSGEGNLFVGLEYYEEAIENFRQKNLIKEDSVFWIFSDDYEWCRNVFMHHFKCFKMNFQAFELNDVESFELMRHFSAMICANSTYSLWASYLSYQDNKTVLFPEKWLESYRKLGYELYR